MRIAYVELPGHLGWHIAVGGDLELAANDTLATIEDGWFALSLPLRHDWTKIVIGMGHEAAEARDACEAVRAAAPDVLLAGAARRWSQRWQGWPAGCNELDRIARRGLAYALSCCVIPVDRGACLITG